MKKRILLYVFLFLAIGVSAQNFTKSEKDLIQSGDTKAMLKVIQITEEKELKILKSVSADIDPKDKLLPLLAERMYLAMRDPANPGIGIAAPQVGINRNVIWVQRFDKEGEPFELYLNPKIVWSSALLRKGMEGCLSIPDISGNVLRNYTIKLAYQDKNGKQQEEIIEGFTAVIFQHETDHLKGILFTDRMKEQEKLEVSPVSNEINLFIEKRLKRQ
ncbi:peptide deformylase [Flavobacterium microcysteis]|uniref:Peptide deformylase n=1 Tax=Flavobacterium microcysteis TaxID=2596891 RepID=A0A501QE84_9FLAO|nr:peptide deformylase [Flavobacterium microcysteis]TPD71189.1 peptide deformylase [Flavobacterium microcysteis]